ncbi:CHAT domain-containing protein [Micromonospora palomenae]|uniref:CHAT domain-containing protein n=1 Tax=Micromonospora palomenae TaxID=1461247 RepID=A0A561WWD2_9ACTN|nr:CHAT domain-containing protein [Micromonospora palomenae]TWG28149.1 CHAT domain-containing protein [Micromonospora palomenae]
MWLYIAAWTIIVLVSWRLFAKRKLLWLLLAGAALYFLHWELVLLGPVLHLLLRLVQMSLRTGRIEAPQPRLRRWQAMRHPRTIRLIRRGDRLLQRFNPQEALVWYRRAVESDPPIDLLATATVRCSAALEAQGDLQEALDTAIRAERLAREYPELKSAVTPAARFQQAVVLGQIGRSEESVTHLEAVESTTGVDPFLKARATILRSENLVRAGKAAEATRMLEAAGRAGDFRRSRRLTTTYWLALSAAKEAAGDFGGAETAADEATEAIESEYLLPASATSVVISNVHRLVEAEIELSAPLVRQAQLRMAKGDTDLIEDKIGFRHSRSAGRAALAGGDLLGGARAALVLSQAALQEGRPDVAEWYSSRALVALHRSRYLLRSQAHRHSWTRATGDAAAVLLEATAMRDHGALLEIIESLRLQALPGTTADNEYAAGELPLATATAVSLGPSPRTTLGRLTAVDRQVISIRETGEKIASGSATWFGLWVSGDRLYWGVSEPAGDGFGGWIPFDANAPARAALRLLHDALPIARPREAPVISTRRAAQGPLSTTWTAERDLIRQVSDALLPTRLREHLRTGAPGSRPCLVIAPPAELAHVPWGLLHVADDDRRVVEVADWTLAPSVSLLDRVLTRRSPRTTGLGVAVLDPTGGETSVRGQKAPLTAAQKLKSDIPATATVLTGPWDGTSPAATRQNLSDALRALGSDRAAFFACHCSRAPVGLSAQSSLLLTSTPEEAGDATLSAQDLLTDSAMDPAFPIPSEVVLSTCDSAGASTAAGGEWLSVGPAALWAGASAVVVSLFPVFDNHRLDAHLVQQAADPGRTTTLACHLLDFQRKALAAWRDGDGDAAPLWWAGYAPLGHLYISDEPPARRAPRAASATVAGPQPAITLSAEAVRFIEEAGSIYEMIRPKIVTTLDVAAEWMSDNDEDAWNGTVAATMQNLFAADVLPVDLLRDATLGPIRAWEARRPHPMAGALSESFVKVIEETAAAVSARGRLVIQPEDLVLTLLNAPTPARGLFRVLRYGRRAQVVNGLTVSADWCSPYRWTSLGKIMFSKPERLESIAALGLTPPEPEHGTRNPDDRQRTSFTFSTGRWT